MKFEITVAVLFISVLAQLNSATTNEGLSSLETLSLVIKLKKKIFI